MAMKKQLFVGAILALALMPTGLVYAENILDANRLSMISQRCTVIQTIIDQLQRRDLVARTNRGRSYEAQVKQIDAFLQRMHTNNLSTETLDGSTASFKASVDEFRNAYVQYDDRITALRQIDCRTKPADFATTLEQVRVLRQEVGAAVTKGDNDLAVFRQAVEALQPTLPDARGGAQ